MKEKEYCVYQHIDRDGECIYVGFTGDIKARHYQHFAEAPHKHEICRVLHSNVSCEEEARFYEYYYIQKLDPVNNVAGKNKEGKFSSWVPEKELDFEEYSLEPLANHIKKHLDYRDALTVCGCSQEPLYTFEDCVLYEICRKKISWLNLKAVQKLLKF